MPSITEGAKAFFAVCKTGKGCEGCAPYRILDVGFGLQSEPLADVQMIAGQAEWMKGLPVFMPDTGHVVKSFATNMITL
ncbi:MAG: hypothetical protein EXR05_04380 [Acetobacteraceae bacterium]|nr:hypothetical protein [Acetobacteraceae bacterium]